MLMPPRSRTASAAGPSASYRSGGLQSGSSMALSSPALMHLIQSDSSGVWRAHPSPEPSPMVLVTAAEAAALHADASPVSPFEQVEAQSAEPPRGRRRGGAIALCFEVRVGLEHVRGQRLCSLQHRARLLQRRPTMLRGEEPVPPTVQQAADEAKHQHGDAQQHPRDGRA